MGSVRFRSRIERTSIRPTTKKMTTITSPMMPLRPPFGPKVWTMKPHTPDLTHGQVDPDRKHDQRHAQRRIQVSRHWTEQRRLDCRQRKHSSALTPADRADAGKQAEPVRHQNEEEQRGQEREGGRRDLLADDAFNLVVEELDDRLRKILLPLWAPAVMFFVAPFVNQKTKTDDDKPDEHRVGDKAHQRQRLWTHSGEQTRNLEVALEQVQHNQKQTGGREWRTFF